MMCAVELLVWPHAALLCMACGMFTGLTQYKLSLSRIFPSWMLAVEVAFLPRSPISAHVTPVSVAFLAEHDVH